MTFNTVCTGRDCQENLYNFHISNETTKYRVNIANEDETPSWGILDFQFDVINDDTLHCSNMYIDNEDYKSKGIPDAVIMNLAKILNKTIVSSTRFKDNGEHLHEPAKKVWERLVTKGVAHFDETTGRYKINEI